MVLVLGLIAAFQTALSPGSAAPVDIDKEKAALLRIHSSDRAAHFETDVERLLAHSSETFLAVAEGTIRRTTLAEQRTFFQEYFRGAKYFEWDDLEPPIVRVSADGTMGWMIVRTRVRRTQRDSSGVERERRFVYAGIMTYEKRDGRWVRTANVSTFERSDG